MIWSEEKGQMVRHRASTGTTDSRKAQALADGLESAAKAARNLAGQEISKAHVEAMVLNVLTIAGVSVEKQAKLPNLEDWISDYVEWKRPRVKGRSILLYEGSLRKIKLWLSTLNLKVSPDLDWLTDEKVEDYYSWLRSNLSIKTSREHIKFLGRAMKRAVEKTALLKNPVDGIELEKRGNTLDRLPFTLAEARMIYSHLLTKGPREREWARAVALSLMSGCRLEDALTMEQDAIVDGVLTYRQQKTGKNISCPMVIPDWLELITETKSGPICPDLCKAFAHRGTATVSGEFTGLVSDAGVKQSYREFKSGRKMARKTFHSLRHTLRSAIVNSGGSDAQADIILGHSAGQGKRYTHSELESMRETLSSALK